LWRDRPGPELDFDSIRWLYAESHRLGIPQLVIWGGEPLLRADLPLLLREARRTRHFITLISNGWLLPRRWLELRGLVDALIVSVDDAGPRHDEIRGVPGLFARLEEFAATLRSDPLSPRLFVNTVLSDENRGALRRVAEVARRWQAGLFFCPMETGEMRSNGFAPLKEELGLAPAELSQAASLASTLQNSGYPLLASRSYLEILARDPALTSYVCRVPRAILTVNADGSIRDCLRREQPLTNVRELMAEGAGLGDILRLPRYQELLEESLSCTACNNPDVLETSWLWELRPVMLERIGRLAFSRR
jgi:MoaA/NifB/PqqE/SkfB family radical SAM enzyme